MLAVFKDQDPLLQKLFCVVKRFSSFHSLHIPSVKRHHFTPQYDFKDPIRGVNKLCWVVSKFELNSIIKLEAWILIRIQSNIILLNSCSARLDSLHNINYDFLKKNYN